MDDDVAAKVATIGSLASGVLCATAWFVFIDSL